MPICATAPVVAGHGQHRRMSMLKRLIMADRRITVRELSLQLDISEASVCRIVKQFGYCLDKGLCEVGSSTIDRHMQGAVQTHLFGTACVV